MQYNLFWQLLEEVIERMWTRAMKALHPLSCPWNVCSSYCSHHGSPFKDVTLREQCVVETIWTEYMTEPQ